MATATRPLEQEVGPRAGMPGPSPDGDGRFVEVEGQRFRRRNPVTELLLAGATLGIWALVWHYRTNDDARRFLRDPSIKPGVDAMMFMTGMAAPIPLVVSIVLTIVGVAVPLWLWLVSVAALLVVPLPLMVSVYRTGQRIARMQERAGVDVTPFGLAGVLLSPALLHIPLYQSALNEIFGAGPSVPGLGLVKGLTVTLKHLLSRSVTQEYPHEKPDLPARTRGVIALKPENCTVCWKCSRECPDWCIYIDAHKETHPPASGGRARSVKVLDRFAIDYALCMYCGICVEVCPFDALFWSPEFEYSVYDLAELTHEKDKLQEWTYTVLPPPELEEGAEPVETAPAGAAEHSEAPTAVPPVATPGAAEPERRPAAGAQPPTADVAPPTAQAAQPPQAQEAPAPAETTAGTPAAGEEPAPQKPAPETAHVEPDQETYDRVLKEQLDAGTDRRVAEGRAKSAAIRAARQKAQG